MAMHRRAGQEDVYQDDAHAYYDDDHSKEKRGLFSALDPFFGRITGMIRIPKHWVNLVASLCHQKPSWWERPRIMSATSVPAASS